MDEVTCLTYCVYRTCRAELHLIVAYSIVSQKLRCKSCQHEYSIHIEYTSCENFSTTVKMKDGINIIHNVTGL